MIRKMIALAGLGALFFIAARPAVSATGSTEVSSPATDGTLKALRPWPAPARWIRTHISISRN